MEFFSKREGLLPLSKLSAKHFFLRFVFMHFVVCCMVKLIKQWPTFDKGQAAECIISLISILNFFMFALIFPHVFFSILNYLCSNSLLKIVLFFNLDSLKIILNVPLLLWTILWFLYHTCTVLYCWHYFLRLRQ